ncbi:hypothetical protein [Spirosoma endophyticum]|uniref:Uncharacterized protein n=1 Tax=Spirosoma endophyticum TaxID=662367 RepID=A0A1I2HXC6_9BACT|nr:hypothetical protein [Spirosoma endophyticum]SFF34103.1 hypothetical protein SAMN05216167_15019 [Spirosoma endophyticum]
MADQDPLTKLELSKQQSENTITELPLSSTLADILEETGKKGKGGRRRHAPDVGVWSIRGIEFETRTAFEKAAERRGKTIGQYLNEDLRQYAQEQLKKGNQPPARQEDLRTEIDDLKSVVVRLAERTELDNQRDEELRIIREAIQQRPTSFREWLFGKK